MCHNILRDFISERKDVTCQAGEHFFGPCYVLLSIILTTILTTLFQVIFEY